MADLIDRQEAIRIASGYCHPANVVKELAKLPSAQPEHTDNAEFWRKRAEEYGKICFDLYMSMLEGTKFDTVKITEDGIVLMQKGGKE